MYRPVALTPPYVSTRCEISSYVAASKNTAGPEPEGTRFVHPDTGFARSSAQAPRLGDMLPRNTSRDPTGSPTAVPKYDGTGSVPSATIGVHDGGSESDSAQTSVWYGPALAPTQTI